MCTFNKSMFKSETPSLSTEEQGGKKFMNWSRGFCLAELSCKDHAPGLNLALVHKARHCLTNSPEILHSSTPITVKGVPTNCKNHQWSELVPKPSNWPRWISPPPCPGGMKDLGQPGGEEREAKRQCSEYHQAFLQEPSLREGDQYSGSYGEMALFTLRLQQQGQYSYHFHSAHWPPGLLPINPYRILLDNGGTKWGGLWASNFTAVYLKPATTLSQPKKNHWTCGISTGGI